MTRRPTLNQVAAALALLYAILVVAMNLSSLGGGVAALVYVVAAIVAPAAVFVGENLAHRGNRWGEGLALAGLGTIFGIWALPSSSGAIALLAIIAGLRSVAMSSHRGRATLGLLTGVGLGVILLVGSFRSV
jgi:hypothetical protein